MPAEDPRYWEQRHAAEDSLDAVGWTGLGRAFNARMYAVRRAVFSRAVRDTVRPGPDTRVLDIGSGTGFYLDAWRALGAGHVEGSDIAETAAERLRERRPGTPIHRFDLGGERDGLPAGPYDAVSAMDMLFHIMDSEAYARAVGNLAALVRPGGHVVLTENLLRDGRVHAGPVQVSRSEDEILGLLRASGLEPVKRVPMFVLLNGPVDSRNPLLRAWWGGLTRVVSYREWLGRAIGAVLYPAELAAVRLARRGPSTKLLVCRRSGA
jgi:SAM-dependent methyltransferase